MNGNKSITFSVSSKVAIAAALGAGVVVGASVAYLINRVNEHTHLTQQITSLHETILQVRKDLASLETGLTQKDFIFDNEGLTQEDVSDAPQDIDRADEGLSRASSFRKKTVSFSSTTTSASYKTAKEYDSDNRATDTDYFSPDEDDDEFFDLSPEGGSGLVIYDDSKFGAIEGEILAVEDVDNGYLQILTQIDELIDGTGDEQSEAYSLLKNVENQYSGRSDFLWRLAKATRNKSVIEEKLGNAEEKKRLIFEAFEYADKALVLCQDDPNIHKWYAILAGGRGEYMPVKDRIQSGHVFKEHIDEALKLNPQDSTLHHLLGRFCYEVSQLSWIERKVAETLFGSVPSASVPEALQHFRAAEFLKPTGWKENRLFISKCNIQLGNYAEAATWLSQGLAAPIITPDDEAVHKEVVELHSKYATFLE